MDPLAIISSQTASLTVAVFDASTATDWVHTKAAATKAQFTGHPAEIMRGLGKGEDVAPVDIGASNGFAFELEGASGKIAIYRIDDRTIALVAPPDAVVAEALTADGIAEAVEVGELEVTSGRLAAVYIWHKKVGAAQATIVAPSGATTFGDGYGEGDGGAVIEVGSGTHRLYKRELDELVVMYIARQ